MQCGKETARSYLDARVFPFHREKSVQSAMRSLVRAEEEQLDRDRVNSLHAPTTGVAIKTSSHNPGAYGSPEGPHPATLRWVLDSRDPPSDRR